MLCPVDTLAKCYFFPLGWFCMSTNCPRCRGASCAIATSSPQRLTVHCWQRSFASSLQRSPDRENSQLERNIESGAWDLWNSLKLYYLYWSCDLVFWVCSMTLSIIAAKSTTANTWCSQSAKPMREPILQMELLSVLPAVWLQDGLRWTLSKSFKTVLSSSMP